jgi:hypothetical protein
VCFRIRDARANSISADGGGTWYPAYRGRQMLVNITIDIVVGSIPLYGDAFDFAYKSNLKCGSTNNH